MRVRLRVTPRARQVRIDGVHRDADGTPRLKLAVTDPPEDGRANAAVIALLAKEWRLSRSRLSVVSGATDRSKTVLVEGEADQLLRDLLDWATARSLISD